MATPAYKLHEARLTRVEDKVGDCKVDIGVVKSQLQGLTDQVAEGVDRITEKLDAIGSIDQRVTALETNDRVRAELAVHKKESRGRRFKVVGLLFAAIGAIGGLIAKALFGG